MGTDTLRIGNAGGYWGDDLGALQRQIEGGPIDVTTMDFLAEITMSILHKQLKRDPNAGYAALWDHPLSLNPPTGLWSLTKSARVLLVYDTFLYRFRATEDSTPLTGSASSHWPE